MAHSGGVDLGVEAAVDSNLALDFNHLRLTFFDRWLKDAENGPEAGIGREADIGWEDDAPVKIFVMGGGSGRKDTYPQRAKQEKQTKQIGNPRYSVSSVSSVSLNQEYVSLSIVRPA